MLGEKPNKLSSTFDVHGERQQECSTIAERVRLGVSQTKSSADEVRYEARVPVSLLGVGRVVLVRMPMRGVAT